MRVDPSLSVQRRTTEHTRIAIQQLTPGSEPRVIVEHKGLSVPLWSPAGDRFAYTIDTPGGMELWIVDVKTGATGADGAKPEVLTPRLVPGVLLSDVGGSPLRWINNGRELLVRQIPADRGPAPVEPATPTGPLVQSTSGQKAKASTYQDLLKDPHDEKLFEFYATAQLTRIDAATLQATPIGKPGLFTTATVSPNGRYMVVTKLKKPFSYRVPYSRFARTVEIVDLENGATLRTLSDIEAPQFAATYGVSAGGRMFEWDPHQASRLYWVETLDGGNPETRSKFRDRLVTLAAPFDGPIAEVLQTAQRLSDLDFTTTPDEVLITETNSIRRWKTVARVDLQQPVESRRVLFDLSTSDAYRDPGKPVRTRTADGQSVILKQGEAIFMEGTGGSPEGDHPFLDRIDLVTGVRDRLFRSQRGTYETFVAFADDNQETILTQYQSPASTPNYHLRQLPKVKPQPLTEFVGPVDALKPVGYDSAGRPLDPYVLPAQPDFPVAGMDLGAVTKFQDPHPQFTSCTKELLTYSRADGVPLSATLYLPPGYDRASKVKLPVIMYAYPREYSDAQTAGQVRGSPNKFTRLWGASPLMFLTQGYAVMMDTAMPIVGSPRKMNDTYVEQLVADAQAAVNIVTELGVGDPDRILVTGHSYGAFMTANLLAHTDLFATGVACSGAYNRTLTPFGFQNEPRTFWEAPTVYAKMSPFFHANRIKEPIMLIHGQEDQNSGTFPMQSERFYEALAANGATARLVVLPHEGHGYLARESILHQLAEMTEWADRHAKHGKRAKSAPSSPAQDIPKSNPAAADAGIPKALRDVSATATGAE
ncbi:MAG: prolyl oligopeptidase [Planctomyces sp.]|nr:prolyl oligopeptidase [Planctomyces sp.]